MIFALAVVLLGAIALYVFLAMAFRTVVPTNEVHIIQSAGKTTSYGKDQAAGNSYYKWPSWVPVFGIKTIAMPTSVFDVDLDGYAAYDKGRVPFVVDIMAFFRVTDSNLAAQRVSSQNELISQLQGILQGACRTMLARSEIEEILEGRAQFGLMFTQEVDHQLENWGVQSVKQIEIMDIRDGKDSNVIANIMAKKKSLIEKESRIEVAKNKQQAQEAEIAADQSVAIKQQDAKQQVGIRAAEQEKQVGIAAQKAQQEIKEAEKDTAEREMAVKRVNQVREAEIKRDAQVVLAEQEKQVAVVKAEGDKQKTILVAEGHLEQQKLNAQGIEVEGKARGAAEQAVLMAPVTTQIELAREIGANDGYQRYLTTIRGIEKDEVVGQAQAEALKAADVKIISNTGQPVDGLKNAMELFSSKGGTNVGAMVEAFANTPTGANILSKINGGESAVDGRKKGGGKPAEQR